MNTAILGLQWGDEGKGKITDYYANMHDVVVRFSGGPNAGHTIYKNNKKIVLHQIPAGILHNKISVISNGCIIDIYKLFNEIEILEELNIDVQKYLKISSRAHIITSEHIEQDIIKEESGNGNGSTKCGIGPCYSDKISRDGITIDMWLKQTSTDSIESIYKRYLSECVINTEHYLHDCVNQNKSILFEGAQATHLDIDFGMYPNVSSSNCTIGGILTGTGLNHKNINKVIGIVKSYNTRVGSGPFVSTDNNCDQLLRDVGNEYGATTGRPRKCGWLDLFMIKYSCMINGVDEIILTKLDILTSNDFKNIKLCIGYKYNDRLLTEFPTNENILNECTPIYVEFEPWRTVNDATLYKYINYIEEYLNIPVKCISYGKNKDDLYFLNNKSKYIKINN